MGLRAGEGVDSRLIAYGQKWPLEEKDVQRKLAWLVCEGLRPLATHSGTPCTHMCLLGNKRDAEETPELFRISRQILEHQRAHGLLASNEQPLGPI